VKSGEIDLDAGDVGRSGRSWTGQTATVATGFSPLILLRVRYLSSARAIPSYSLLN